MPGRHGGGPMGGGFRGGGMGGGFRGGGMPGGGMGGGFRGPGFGGGWRPRGPWGGGFGGYRRPFFGGWRGWFPWIPFMGYGGGYGYGGGGWGCGPAGCIVLVLIFGCLLVIGLGSSSFGGYRTYGYRNSGDTSNSNTDYNYNNNGAPNLADESGPVQTQTAQDLTELHQAFDSRIPTWMNQLSANQEKSIPAADAGLTQDNNTKAVIYGKCGSAFYVYVVENTAPDNVPQANGEGYVYTTASSPGACHPAEYTVYQSEDVSGGWSFVYLQSVNN